MTGPLFAALVPGDAVPTAGDVVPTGWTSLAFPCEWHGRHVRVSIGQDGRGLEAALEAGEPMALTVQGTPRLLRAGPAPRVRLDRA